VARSERGSATGVDRAIASAGLSLVGQDAELRRIRAAVIGTEGAAAADLAALGAPAH
jgi:hypothetical protein